MASPLPTELLIEIFTHLAKADCKTARLVSLNWSALAARYIFKTIHIGPYDVGLKAFTAVAEHSILRQMVVELSFNARFFEQGISRNVYFQLLLQQIRLELRLYLEQRLTDGIDNNTRRIIRYATEPLPFRAKELVEEEERLCLLPAVRKGCNTYTKRVRQ